MPIPNSKQSARNLANLTGSATLQSKDNFILPMQNPYEFMHYFLAAKVRQVEAEVKNHSAAMEPFYEPDYLPFDPVAQVNHAKSEQVDNIQISGTEGGVETVEVITKIGPFHGRHRYTLKRHGESYRIALMEMACSLCSRRTQINPSCKLCKGKGWLPLPHSLPSSGATRSKLA
jgi:hypothetical protein